MRTRCAELLAAVALAWAADAVVGTMVAPSTTALLICLGLAWALLALARARTRPEPQALSRPAVAFSLAFACAAMLDPLTNPAAFLMIAAALLDLAGRPGLRVFAAAARSLAIGFLAAVAALRLAEMIEVRHLAEAALLEPFAWLLHIAGQDFSRVDAALAIDLDSRTVFLRADYYKAGLSQALAFVGGLLVISGSRFALRSWTRRLLEIVLLVLGFCFLRFIVVVLLTLILEQDLRLILQPFWARAWLLLIVPLACFGRRPLELVTIGRPRRRIGYASVGLALGLSLWTLVPDALGDPGAGVVVLDESHSDWERSDALFDEESWGRAATYAYGSLGRLLEDRGPFRRHFEGPLDGSALADCRVLLLKTPSRPYEPEEIDAIDDFVRSGGGLLLIGDHTNLFGMGVHLNALATRFGLAFEYDAAFEAYTGNTTFVEEVWPAHPVAAGSRGMAFQTSCTIRPLGAAVEPVFVGRRLAAELADYSNPNFFGDMRADCADRLGTFLVGAAVRHGEGRVIAFSDSTILSNFSLYDEGVSEMLRSSLGWLERGDAERCSCVAFLPALIAALLLLGLLVGGFDWAAEPLFGSLLLLALAAGLSWSRSASLEQNLELRGPEHLSRVSFVADASTEVRTSFIDDALSLGPAKTGEGVFGNFFISVQRLGNARPQRHADLRASLADEPELIVLNQPAREPSLEERRALKSYVLDGGRLLVLDDPSRAGASTANAWLASFAMKLDFERDLMKLHEASWPGEIEAVAERPVLAALALGQVLLQRKRSAPAGETIITRGDAHYIVEGGDALWIDEQARVITAQARRGAGRVTVHARASMLDDLSLGNRASSRVSDAQRSRGRIAVELLRLALAEHPVETLTSTVRSEEETRHEVR